MEGILGPLESCVSLAGNIRCVREVIRITRGGVNIRMGNLFVKKF